MRQTGLRWGLIMGGVAATVGLAAQLLGLRFKPTSGTDFSANFAGILVFDIAVLFALGIALGIAYYAGMRVEHERPPTPSAEMDPLRWGGERRDSALAGAIVMACFWLVTTLAAVALGQYASGAGGLTDYLTRRIIALVLFVVLGFGLGAWGARARIARNLLDQIAVTPTTPRVNDGTLHSNIPATPGESTAESEGNK